jgi:hypothetical protein
MKRVPKPKVAQEQIKPLSADELTHWTERTGYSWSTCRSTNATATTCRGAVSPMRRLTVASTGARQTTMRRHGRRRGSHR